MRYKPREAAEYLQVDLETLRSATMNREIGSLRLSPRRTVYEKADLDAWKASWTRVEAIGKATD